MKTKKNFQKRRVLTAIFVAAAMIFSSSVAMADTVLLTTDENLVGVYSGNDSGVDGFLGKFDDNGNWDGGSVDGVENVEIQNGGQDAVFDVTTSILLAQFSVKASNRYALYNIPGGTLYAGTTYAVTSQHLVNDGGQQPDISHVSFFGSGDPVQTPEPSATPGPSATPDPSATPGPSATPNPSATPEPEDDDDDDGNIPLGPGNTIPLGPGGDVDAVAIPLAVPRTGDGRSITGLFLILGSILFVGGAMTLRRRVKRN